jgi:hypothetical protein
MVVSVREVKDERRPHWRSRLGILLSLKRLRPIGQIDERVKFVKCEGLDTMMKTGPVLQLKLGTHIL